MRTATPIDTDSPQTPGELRRALTGCRWLEEALVRVAAEPLAIAVLFPAAGRHCGREDLRGAPGWTADDAARVVLLAAVPLRGPTLSAAVTSLYRYGDVGERRAVLRALQWLYIGGSCVDLLRDALRTNDTRLVAAALGPCAAHLDDAAWRQGVLKCVFMGVPLSVVDGLSRRADGELGEMLAELASERHAAGRYIPTDAAALLAVLRRGGGHGRERAA